MKDFYLRRTELRMRRPLCLSDAFSSMGSSKTIAPRASGLTATRFAGWFVALETRAQSARIGLRTVKSFEVLSVKDTSSGISADTIAHKSKDTTNRNSSLPRMERYV